MQGTTPLHLTTDELFPTDIDRYSILETIWLNKSVEGLDCAILI